MVSENVVQKEDSNRIRILISLGNLEKVPSKYTFTVSCAWQEKKKGLVGSD